MAISDMTKVGKECAIAALISTKWGIDCFEKAGFTTPCATIWTCVALRVVCCGVTILLPMSCGNHAAGCPCWEQADGSPCACVPGPRRYDALYDGHNCRDICIKDLLKPFNGPPPFCPLNACLQCDEDKAGPVFKAYAGATRRRTGLQSNIARPCSSVAQLDHTVCPPVKA